MLTEIRKKHEKLSYPNQLKSHYKPEPLLVEEAKKLLAFMKAEPKADTPEVQEITQKLESRIEKEKITPRFLMKLPLEYVAAVSDITEEELNFYQHVLAFDDAKYLHSKEELVHAAKFLIPGKAKQIDIALSEELHRRAPYGKVSSGDIERILEENQGLVGTIGYPIAGISKFSITLMNALMSEQLAPISIPSKIQKNTGAIQTQAGGEVDQAKPIGLHDLEKAADTDLAPALNIIDAAFDLTTTEGAASDLNNPNLPAVIAPDLIQIPQENAKEQSVPQLKAHGINIDSEGFTIHDYSHQRLIQANESNAFENYVLSQSNKAFDKGQAVDPFVTDLLPKALDRHNGIYHLFQVIMLRLMDRALETKDIASFKQAMAGQFMMQREYPGLSYEAYEMDSAKCVIHTIADKTYDVMSSPSVWLSPQDPLKTSPVDGTSALTDEKIVEKTIKSINKETPQETVSGSYNAAPSAEDIYKYDVKRHPRYIDVAITLKNGRQIHQTYFTNYHKWTNLDDTLSILNYAGIKISKPSLEGKDADKARKICFGVLSQTHQQALAQVSHYVTVATDVLKEPIPTKDGSKNIEQAYKKWSQSLQPTSKKD
jgi:hypothetical protein